MNITLVFGIIWYFVAENDICISHFANVLEVKVWKIALQP